MPASFLALNRAMGYAGVAGPEPSWGDVMGELWPIISVATLLGWRAVAAGHHQAPRASFCLTETAELPHSLMPEEMLKSLTEQRLARWTRLTYFTELQRLELYCLIPGSAQYGEGRDRDR